MTFSPGLGFKRLRTAKTELKAFQPDGYAFWATLGEIETSGRLFRARSVHPLFALNQMAQLAL
jgi:hypothetical protein